MNSAANMPKPRKLWGNPKVSLTNNELIIEGKFYPLAQTLGAYVEIVPAEKVEKAEATAPAPKKPVTFGSIMKTIGFASIFIFLFLFALFFDDFSWGGSNTPYRLVLNNDFGRANVIQHTNRGKLNKIAEAVNQRLIAMGRQPVTHSFEADSTAH